ncbi:hypothetical protein GCM10027294_22260 [Marinactinospora endophytica]
MTDQFTRLAAEAGLPPITLHGLRHGAASLSLTAGVDVKVVSAELGHSTAFFTQDTYQTVYPEVARAAAEATAALIPLDHAPSGRPHRGGERARSTEKGRNRRTVCPIRPCIAFDLRLYVCAIRDSNPKPAG